MNLLRLTGKQTLGSVLLGLLLFLGACSEEPIESRPAGGWTVSSPEDEGMDSGLLLDMLDEIGRADLPLHGVVVARHGRLVIDSYFEPYTVHDKHIVYSATKSITAMLIGAAIDDGLIPDDTLPVVDLLPGRQQRLGDIDIELRQVELRHLLSMTSGIDWQDHPYGVRESGDFSRLLAAPDGIAFILGKSLAAPPGSIFNYNSGGSHLLAAVIQEATGRTVLDYADERLFRPMGIHDTAWSAYQGINNGGSELFLRPRDMARIGLMILRGGLWNDTRLLSEEWIDRLTRPLTTNDFAGMEEGYGYGWYTKRLGGQAVWSAEGFGGNGIFVIPSQDLVVVFTGGLAAREMLAPYRYLEDFILPSVISDDSLSQNPAAENLLEASLHRSRQPSNPKKPVPPNTQPHPPERSFRIEDGDNLLGIKTLSFDLSQPDSGTVRIAYSGTGRDEDWGVDILYRTDELVEDAKEVDIAFGLDGWSRTTTVEHDEVGSIPISAIGRWEEDGRLVLKVTTGWAIPQTWIVDFSHEDAVSLTIESVFYQTTVAGRATLRSRPDEKKG